MQERSSKLFQKAQEIIPGGVNSPVRAFRSVGSEPLFVSRASGSRVYSEDGGEYIDYIGSWGPMILGHACPAVIEAVQAAAARGTSYGIPTALEVEMADLIVAAFPSIDMVRMVSSGTEATMSAVRLARGYTGRDRIVKFEGCYHGHADSLLVKAGSGVATLGIPGSPGVPEALASLTLALPYNDIGALRSAIKEYGPDIACVIVEPVAGNMGVVPPQPGFLEELRTLTRENGIILIFDEVITGFRLAYGGFQTMIGIEPDLTCLGKIIGGGLPVGAFGGKRDIMEQMAPAGPVYQAGTLSGNPLALTAGITTLRLLKERSPYRELDNKAGYLCQAMEKQLVKKGIPHRINRVGSMFTLFFAAETVKDFASAGKADTAFFSRYFQAMLERGVLIAPSQFEASFLSQAHTDQDIETTIGRFTGALETI